MLILKWMMLHKLILKNNLPEKIWYIHINSQFALVEQSTPFSFHFSKQFCYSYSQLQKVQEKQGVATDFEKSSDTMTVFWA